jgi:hypothetical protein
LPTLIAFRQWVGWSWVEEGAGWPPAGPAHASGCPALEPAAPRGSVPGQENRVNIRAKKTSVSVKTYALLTDLRNLIVPLSWLGLIAGYLIELGNFFKNILKFLGHEMNSFLKSCKFKSVLCGLVNVFFYF